MMFERIRLAKLGSLVAALSLSPLSATANDPADAPVVDISVAPEGRYVFEALDSVGLEKQAADDPAELVFRGGVRLRPEPGIASEVRLPLSGTMVLQFPAPIRHEWRSALVAAGVSIRDYIQGNAYLVEVPESASETLLAWVGSRFVRSIVLYPLVARVERGLAERVQRATQNLHERVTVRLLHPLDAEEFDRVAAVLAVESASADDRPALRGYVLTGDLQRLAALPFIEWIENYADSREQNFEGAMSGGVDRIQSIGTYTGAGVRVAVIDSGIARSGTAADCGPAAGNWHPDLSSARVADDWDFFNGDTNACDSRGHGTHVAGTIAGDGTNTTTHKGMAPGATLLIYKDCCDANGFGFRNFSSALTRAAANDALVVGNSWGGGNGIYNANAEDADDAARGVFNGSDGLPQRMLLTVSAGNDNDLVSSPASAKNVIAVAATKDGHDSGAGGACWCVNNNLNGCATNCDGNPGVDPSCFDNYWVPTERICFSNYGKIDTDGDGYFRLKPDIAAPGTRIESTAASHLYADSRLYTLKDGTSMAQPMVAGAAALVYDAFDSVWDWPEMVKAKLLATAVDMGDRTRFGHGMLDTFHAVYDSSSFDTLRWSGRSISGTGNEVELTFDVPAGFREVRVYIAWSDPSSSSTEVVNDLDLRVYDAANVLVGSSTFNDETVESVRVTSGTSGQWRAVIRGENVPQPSQRFGMIAVARLRDATLSLSASVSDSCVRPGQAFSVSTTASNSGYTVAATSVELDLPDDDNAFELVDVDIPTEDPARSKTLDDTQIWLQWASNQYDVTVGEVNSSITRDLTWNLRAGAAASDAEYLLYLSTSGRGSSTTPIQRRIRIDSQPPSVVRSLTSSSHVIGKCSNSDAITMQWVAAGDPGQCDIDGYGLLWTNTAPALPGQVKDIEEVTTITQTLGSSASGRYFNIRAVDNAGNWSDSYESSGPYYIDTVDPGDATALSSPSHPIGSCSGNNSVTIKWSAAPDAHCGVDGYGLNWTLGATGIPSAVKDIEEVTQVTQTVAYSNSPRYFNIRSVDNAGNWADGFAWYGPFTIDRLPAAINGVSVTKSGTDLRLSWSAAPDADYYRVYRSASAQMTGKVQRGGDVAAPATTSLDAGAATDGASIYFYQIVGTNICGAAGP
ncbi:MAG: S8 family peptidase [Acidobacteriota bacterium]